MENKSINFDLFINKSNNKKCFEENESEKNLVTEKEEKSIFSETFAKQHTETGVENNLLTNPIYSKEKDLSIFSGIFNDEQDCIFNDVNKTNEIDIQECSAVRKPEVMPKYKDDGTKDGKIGDTKQGQTGDCGLLAAITSFKYNEAGRETIEKALEYKDGYTIVHTAAGDYIVTDEELAVVRSAANSKRQYSTGDDDMLILELAIEKIVDDMANGELSISSKALEYEDTWHYLYWQKDVHKDATSINHSSLQGTYSGFVLYLLTGKPIETAKDVDPINKKLDEFQNNNGKDLTISAVSNFVENKDGDYDRGDGFGMRKFTDLNTGKEIELINIHGYSVKKVDNESVTIVNPWDSSKEIRISRDEFAENFDLYSVDQSDNNPVIELFNKPQTSEEKVGDETYKVKTLIDENGKIINKTYISNDGSYAIRFSYDENEEIEHAGIWKYNENNQFIQEYGLDGIEEAQNIINRGLLNNPRFDYEDIATSHIGSISDEEWESIQQYLNVPGLKSQLSAAELWQLSKLSDEDKQFAVDFMLKYPDVKKSAAIYYSNSNYDNYITTDDLKNYANNKSSIIEQFIPNNLEDSWYDGFDLLNLNSSLRDCLKKIEDQCGYKDIEICYQRIIDRHLIANPYILRELDGDDIYYLSFISDDKWDKAMEYLKSNPNLSGKEIVKLLYDYVT